MSRQTQPDQQNMSKPSERPTVDSLYGMESDGKRRKAVKDALRFMEHFFPSIARPAEISPIQQSVAPKMDAFITHIEGRVRLPTFVLYSGLYLLYRLLKTAPSTRHKDPYGLFLTAFMVAAKIQCDDNYNMKAWTTVGRDLFSIQQLCQMERDLCSTLGWDLTIPQFAREEFEARVQAHFHGRGPFAPFEFSPSIGAKSPSEKPKIPVIPHNLIPPRFPGSRHHPSRSFSDPFCSAHSNEERPGFGLLAIPAHLAEVYPSRSHSSAAIRKVATPSPGVESHTPSHVVPRPPHMRSQSAAAIFNTVVKPGGRPLPPIPEPSLPQKELPDIPRPSPLNRPLPPTPSDRAPNRAAKPLPLPPKDRVVFMRPMASVW
ncbi:uncharacterized protein LAESUDRAFT_34130 [Laetiporus sulphureus 93-53]|uniref:Cyclin N-terminal domain-containing protein n=1 Tax=Laetiporus sulphureus 93-53 TaxID=1314785 RepID=A0A165IKD1_9APHY|nr:uncharacterized protein LAESUDRAFT_34130 [Laetiporus sulphureus 93-53]KZT13198.1 hypothetical protein LAESUDRAFT_34130 [Laetiporus sulphureus 93-53]